MSATQNEKATKFRALHTEPHAFIIPNPWDAGSARILAGLGFQALATTSAGFAFSLGRRDGMVTRDEVFAHCRAIAEATDLPVAADLENCFGDDPKTVAERFAWRLPRESSAGRWKMRAVTIAARFTIPCWRSSASP